MRCYRDTRLCDDMSQRRELKRDLRLQNAVEVETWLGAIGSNLLEWLVDLDLLYLPLLFAH